MKRTALPLGPVLLGLFIMSCGGNAAFLHRQETARAIDNTQDPEDPGPQIPPPPPPPPAIVEELHGQVGRFSGTTVTGDFDGDGVLDKVASDGTVRLWFGRFGQTPSGRHVPNVAHFENESSALSLASGHALAVGDFDADGIDDLAIGIPRSTHSGRVRAGAIRIYYGSGFTSHNPSQMQVEFLHQGSPGIKGVPEDHDHFGEFLTAGDFDCDGTDDLAVGIPQEDDSLQNNGYVQVLYGRANVGVTARDVLFHAGYVHARQPWAQFGAAVESIPLRTTCDLLVVGAPGENVGIRSAAGVIYAIPGAPGGLDFGHALRWHRDSGAVLGSTNHRQLFGAEIGKASEAEGGGVWVSVPGARCRDADERTYHHFRTAGNHLTTTGQRLFCSRHAPGLIEREAGYIVRKTDQFGPYWQYVPQRADGFVRFMVLIHGTPCFLEYEDGPNKGQPCNPIDEADLTARSFLIKRINPNVAGLAGMDKFQYWIDVAERENIVLIAPVFDRPNFFRYNRAWGRVIDADVWVGRIVDSYTRLGHNPSGVHYLYGHSSGGQFITRYLVKQPNRLIAAALSSPKTVARPDPDLTWANGMRARNRRVVDYPQRNGSSISAEHSYTPSADLWRIGAKKRIYFNVGDLERGCTGATSPGDRHVETAIEWAKQTSLFEPNHDTHLCIMPDMKHSSRASGPWAVMQLFPDRDQTFNLPCIAEPTPCSLYGSDPVELDDCLKACDADLEICKSDGHPTPRQCVQLSNECKAHCRE